MIRRKVSAIFLRVSSLCIGLFRRIRSDAYLRLVLAIVAELLRRLYSCPHSVEQYVRPTRLS